MFLMHIVKTNQLQANGVQKQGVYSHNITHYLQILGASPPDSHRGSAPGPRWETSVPRPPGLPLQSLSLNSR